MKNVLLMRGDTARLVLALMSFFLVESTQAAGPFTVNIATDSHASSPASSPNDSNGHISLRSALEAANAQSGSTTITINPGAYNLTLGELEVAPAGGKTITLLGGGASSTIVTQTDPINRVFNVDSNSLGSTFVAISGLTVQGGHDRVDFLGGAGILAGSITNASKDVLGLTNCIFVNNHCTNNTTLDPGGAVQMAGGDLNVTSCVFSNNSSGESLGGAIFVFAQTVVSSLTVSNSVFIGNVLTNNSGVGPDGGGAIMIWTPAGSVHTISGSVFVNNQANGGSSTVGGAVEFNTGTLNIVNSSLVTNSTSGLGGAIYADSGTVVMSFSRLTGNSASGGGGAIYNHASNGAVTTATNDWWGCGGAPGASGCDVASTDNGNLNFTPWLTLNSSASPNIISAGQISTLTATVLQNSSGQILTAARVPALIGLPVTWNAGPHGSLGGVQTTIQPNGQATAIFINDNTCNGGMPSITLDQDIAIMPIIVQCPDLTISKTNNVSGSVGLGNNWIWTVHVLNNGAAAAPFTSASTVVLDNLPSANVVYGSPVIANVNGVSGTLSAGLDVNQNLTVTAATPVTINSAGSFDVQITATPALMTTYANPRTGGVCEVNPNSTVPESSQANNFASNSVTVTCPSITGTVSGGGSICPGNGAIVMVAVSGGVPPYNVTLNNSGGTQSGPGPFFFNVNPTISTVYQISTGTDADGCNITGSGSALININLVTNPVIALSPQSVLADSIGNQASTPAIQNGYAWSISNGTIIGPTNQPSITYTAGLSNNIVLGLSVTTATGCSASNSVTVPLIKGFSTHTNVVFTDALTGTTMAMAFDGTNYWSASGGGASGFRLAKYGLTGTFIASNAPGLDFRSLTTRADGILFARAYNTNAIYQQTSPGVFTDTGIRLTGGALDPQASVILSGVGSEFDAVMTNGVISRWNTNGTYIGSVNLAGFGSVAGENTFPLNRGLATFGSFWLTYNGAGILSIWDMNGNRVGQITLPGAGTSFDSQFGFSFCNGKVFIVDVAGGAWRAFDLYGAAAVAVVTPEQTSAWNADVLAKISSVGFVPKVDFISDASPNPEPTLAQLRAYQSVLVFSDPVFSNPTNLGNALADYTDQGGGVALSTFLFWNGGGLGMEGRLLSGYLPFTTGGQNENVEQTMVIDQPSSPLVDGVTSFDGGGSSYMNNGITTNVGVIQVAHWSGGQPLVAGRNDGAGRNAGLNFFPPSSDSGGGLWVSTTGGARLMADALVWAGRIPPAIITGPINQIVAAGASATFSVIARGATGLGYQWRLNGTNVPGATTSNLTVVAQAANLGTYSVVVSNLYGTTTSLNVALEPPLKFIPPLISQGQISLVLTDIDGTAVASSRANRISLYSSTNLAAPFGQWNLLTNTFVASNGKLVSSSLNANNLSRFFRAVETP